ncbi:MAG: DUF4926 domain-containing protein [Acidobacteriia bacterium]|nr:DUF4926 domain-containing protein [Terriglobia bacterium]
MNNGINLLDVVALTEDLPDRKLRRGQVGTVVEFLAPGVFEIEFTDNDGRAFASLALKKEQLLLLHYEPAA